VNERAAFLFAAAKLGSSGCRNRSRRHEPLQCALELRLAVRLEPADRNHSDPRPSRESCGWRRFSTDGTGKDRARFCAFLLSDAAKDVTGQIFAGCGMNEIFP